MIKYVCVLLTIFLTLSSVAQAQTRDVVRVNKISSSLWHVYSNNPNSAEGFYLSYHNMSFQNDNSLFVKAIFKSSKGVNADVNLSITGCGDLRGVISSHVVGTSTARNSSWIGGGNMFTDNLGLVACMIAVNLDPRAANGVVPPGTPLMK